MTTEEIDMVIKNHKHKKLNGSALKIESTGNAPIITMESHKRKSGELTASEAKRMKSLKQMVQGYQKQKAAIKAALSSVDVKPKNKITFDDEDYNDSPLNGQKKSTQNGHNSKNPKNTLFNDHDEDSEEDTYNFELKAQFEGEKGQKLLALQSKFKSDKRFMMNERFMDDEDDQTEATGENLEEMSTEQEKQKQFEILEQVLGRKITPRETKNDANTSSTLLRFDPSQTEHLKLEVNSSEVPVKKNKHQGTDLANDEANASLENEHPVVSKEVFYKVSDDLKETFQEKQEFSLLSKFGKAEEDVVEEKQSYQTQVKEPKKSKFPIESNPFRYDSSDDDEPAQEKVQPQEKQSIIKKKSVKLWSEPFFFKEDDYRFQDGQDFIKRLGSEDKSSEFGKLRRNLKEIVKAKVKSNQRKNKPFKKKLGGNRLKKNIRMKKALKR